MRMLIDGSSLFIRRNGAGYTVEHCRCDGWILATIDCDDMDEATAALEYGPDRW